MTKSRLLHAFAVVILASLPAAELAAQQGATAPAPRWVTATRATGRLQAPQLGLVINVADPYSVAVGAYYAERRGLRPDQILEVELPLQPRLDRRTFEALRQRIAGNFGARTQALALAWTQPYAVACQSLSGALALGFDETLCQNSCARSRPSPLFDAATTRPWRDLRVRPSMLLAAPDIDAARRLIDRGIAADAALGRRGAPTATALYLRTGDRARNVRAPAYPPAGMLGRAGVDVRVEDAVSNPSPPRVVLLQVGASRLDGLTTQDWVPGALADHLTSYGGRLEGRHGQATALDWIAAGATASHGSASEPCNHLQKFPDPQLLLLHYLQGGTALEAYWKSVAWPQQSVFVGEPLAAPYAR